MTSYEVRVTATARKDIDTILRFLQETFGGDRASAWLRELWDAMTDLETLPRRAARAPQSNHLDYEVRRRVVGETLVFFVIDEPNTLVDVVRVWPARRQPLEPEAFPPLDDEPTLADE